MRWSRIALQRQRPQQPRHSAVPSLRHTPHTHSALLRPAVFAVICKNNANVKTRSKPPVSWRGALGVFVGDRWSNGLSEHSSPHLLFVPFFFYQRFVGVMRNAANRGYYVIMQSSIFIGVGPLLIVSNLMRTCSMRRNFPLSFRLSKTSSLALCMMMANTQIRNV